MGIKGLSGFLKKEYSKCFKYIEMKELHGFRLVIDMGSWLYTYFPGVIKNYMNTVESVKLVEDLNFKEIELRLIESLTDFLIKITGYNIFPICVFDGKSHPLKKQTQIKRRESRPIDKLQKIIKELMVKDELEVTTTEINSYRKLICRCVYISTDIVINISEFLSNFGIPVIHADYEAEYTACSMVMSDLADLVWTRDTDALAIGVPFVITKTINNDSFEITDVGEIRKCLELSSHQFREYCICLGCDFNTNIRNYGPKKVLSLFKKYSNFDTISQHLNTEIINMKTLYPFFYPKIMTPIYFNIDLEEAEQNRKKISELKYDKLYCRLKLISEKKFGRYLL